MVQHDGGEKGYKDPYALESPVNQQNFRIIARLVESLVTPVLHDTEKQECSQSDCPGGHQPTLNRATAGEKNTFVFILAENQLNDWSMVINRFQNFKYFKRLVLSLYAN